MTATRGLALALLSLLPLLSTGAAHAHQIGLSRGTYRLSGAALDAEMVFQNSELTAALARGDQNRNGSLDEAELAAALPALDEAIVQRLKLTADGARCEGKIDRARLVEGDGVELKATLRCPAAPRSLSLDLDYLEKLSHGHRQLASLTDDIASADAVAFAASRTLTLTPGVPPPASSAPRPSASAPPPHAPAPGLGGLFLLGVEHILTGYDHLVFLLGLVLVGGKLRSLLAVVTAFTVAHSITLAIAALGGWSPPARLVEPSIALSIAYVGVENFFVKDAEGRYRITFPFGLIHGFGFAGVLSEIALPRAQIPSALLMFNLGVEAGQLAVMAPLLLVLHLLRRSALFARRGVKAISAVIIAAGLAWFFARVSGA